MITKKYYKEIAKLIKNNGRIAMVRNNPLFVIDSAKFVDELCLSFKQDNPNFNEIKFREATGQILNKVAWCSYLAASIKRLECCKNATL